MNDTELLHKLYHKELIFDLNNLYKRAKMAHPKITKAFVKSWIEQQQSTQQHHKPVGKKTYLPIYSETPFSFQIDLTFMPQYKLLNYGYDVLFTAINVNTRFAYAYPMKDKRMPTILEAMRWMLDKTVINIITCDSGTEFTNFEFKKLCDENNITIFYVVGDSHKLGIINRFHRTLKEKFSRYFSLKPSNNGKWYEALDQVISNYNNTEHSSLGIAPKQVNGFIELMIIEDAMKKTAQLRDDTIQIGDKCRLKLKLQTFTKKSLAPTYSKDIYTVVKVMPNSVIIKNADGEQRAKKTDIIIVPDIDYTVHDAPNPVADKVIREHKTKRKLVQDGLDTTNIITEKRVRKPTVFMNLKRKN